MEQVLSSPSSARARQGAQPRLPSAVSVLFRILGVVFLAEAGVMWLLLPWFGGLPPALANLLDAVALTALSAPALWWLVIRPFRVAAMQEAARIEYELQERQWFREMTELLQTARSRDEVRSVLGLHLTRLFPDTSGMVFVFSPSRDVVETLVGWGLGAPAVEQFPVDDCWGLRLGKAYGLDEAGDALPCQHVDPYTGGYLCVPMLADGETLGVFHLRPAALPDDARPRVHPGSGALNEVQRQRALGAAERLALALANLRLRETLRNQSIRDVLTGLFNRRYMEESLARELKRAMRHKSALSVVMLDLDHFKRLNDMFGHDVGDEMLRAISRFLATHVREEDIACRYGGEEFTLILPSATSDDAAMRTDALRIACADVAVDDRNGGRVSTAFSAGVAAFPEDGSTVESLLRAADGALYRAKTEGRSRVVTANETTTQR